MSRKRITTASAKDKGRRLQKMIAEKIGELLDVRVGKDEPVAPREMSQTGTDIRIVGEYRKHFPFAVECKWQERWDIPGWIKQAKANTDPDNDYLTWLLFVKKNRSDVYVVLEADALFKILSAANMNELYTLLKGGKNESKSSTR